MDNNKTGINTKSQHKGNRQKHDPKWEFLGYNLDNRYKLIEPLGAGGMAEVYLAEDLKEPGRMLAVKMMKKQFAQREEFVSRFRTENRTLGIINHQNVVKVYDFIIEQGTYFIVMEYIDGYTLSELLEKKGTFSYAESINYTIQTLGALGYIHDIGIVHQDIKLQNLMIQKDMKTIKVTDFGIARFNREVNVNLSDKPIGSVHYISPEYIKGETTDERSDIYSIGIMLFEMLTGKRPFEAEKPVSIALMQRDSKLPNMRDINPSIPEGLTEIVEKATRKKPERRYQSAAAMIADLRAIRKNPKMVFGYDYFKDEEDKELFDTGVGKYIDIPERKNLKQENNIGFMNIRNKKSHKSAYEDDEEYGEYQESELDPRFQDPKGYGLPNSDFDDYDEIPQFEEELEAEVPYRRAVVLPIALAVISVMIIIASILIYLIVSNKLNLGSKTIEMPSIVGMTVEEVNLHYNELKIKVDKKYNANVEEGKIIEQKTLAGDKIKSTKEVVVVVSMGPRRIEVPFLGDNRYTEEDALRRLRDDGFVMQPIIHREESDIVEVGKVIRTDPIENTMANEDTVITIYISLGMVSNQVEVPRFEGLSLEAAKKLARDKSLKIKEVYVPSGKDKENYVISQSVDVGELVGAFSEITIEVGDGKELEKSYEINFPVQNTTGMYYIECFVDGTQDEDASYITDLAITQKIYWKISGSGTHRYEIYIQSIDTGKREKFCEYIINFNDSNFNENINRTYLDPDVLKKINSTEEDTTSSDTSSDTSSTSAPDSSSTPSETSTTTTINTEEEVEE